MLRLIFEFSIDIPTINMAGPKEEDVSLKQVFLNSLPTTLVNGTNVYIYQKHQSILGLTPGQIRQVIFHALEDMCHKR